MNTHFPNLIYNKETNTYSMHENNIDYELDVQAATDYQKWVSEGDNEELKNFLTQYERRDKVLVRPCKSEAGFHTWLNSIGHQPAQIPSWVKQ